MYVWMENASVAMGLQRLNQLPHGSTFDLTGWNGLLMGVNLMRMSTLSSDVPVVPWVAYKNDTNMSPFMWMKPMANTHYCTAASYSLPPLLFQRHTQMRACPSTGEIQYLLQSTDAYLLTRTRSVALARRCTCTLLLTIVMGCAVADQEHILHLAMHNPPSMLHFNPCYAVGYCSVTWEDNLLFANLFHELTEMVGCTPSSRKWVSSEFVGWHDEVIATGMTLPDGITVWRVTTFDGKAESYVKTDDGGVTVEVPGAAGGGVKKIVFKGGTSKGAGQNAPFGVWIETAKGSPSPQLHVEE
jgi:hypothetical protein